VFTTSVPVLVTPVTQLRVTAGRFSAMGEGGSVHDKAAPEVAASMRRLLAAIDAGEMWCSKGYRRQLQRAVVALEAMVRCGQADAAGSRPGCRNPAPR
jgi:hypothetical protein